MNWEALPIRLELIAVRKFKRASRPGSTADPETDEKRAHHNGKQITPSNVVYSTIAAPDSSPSIRSRSATMRSPLCPLIFGPIANAGYGRSSGDVEGKERGG